MDGDSDDLKLLLASARAEVEALRGDRRLGDPPGKRGEALRDHVIDLLDAVEHRMGQAPPSGASPRASQAFARSIRQSVVVLRSAHAALPWLRATRTPNINLGSLYLTESFAKALIGPTVDLVPVPNAEYMYSTTSWPFSDVITGTRGFVPKTARRPIVLNYPLSDSDRLLAHPVFAHELGHASVSEHQLVAKVENQLNSDAAFQQAFKDAVDDASTRWGAPPSKVAGTIRQWLRLWIEELLCDHLAIEVMGPAFLWAFACFVLPLSYGEPGKIHPPNTLRMNLALAHLDRRGWQSYMDDKAPGITTWLRAVGADTASIPLVLPFSFLQEQLLAHGKAIQDECIAVSGPDALLPAGTTDEADEAASLLARIVLPLGLEDRLEPRSILLGGWVRAITEHGDDPAGLISALSDTRLQDLVGKAAELSVVSEAWKTTP